MSTTSHDPTSLSLPECRQLLASRDVGRIGWVNAQRPRILPVSYTCVADLIVIRTLPGRILSQLTRHTPVVLEVDDLDEAGRHGWSVLATGVTRPIAPDEVAALVAPRELAEPWSPDQRTLHIAITLETLSGRRFG